MFKEHKYAHKSEPIKVDKSNPRFSIQTSKLTKKKITPSSSKTKTKTRKPLQSTWIRFVEKNKLMPRSKIKL
jgi:hypothetical protein